MPLIFRIIKKRKRRHGSQFRRLKGIDIAALLGITGGNADKALEVLEGIRPEHIRQAQELAEKHICSCTLAEGVSNLYICAKVRKDSHYAEVTIVDQHTNITRIVKDGQVLFPEKPQRKSRRNLLLTNQSLR